MNTIPQHIIDKFDKGKDVSEFNETTPLGNNITGKILLNRANLHGSLLIETVNDKETQQFIRGFPKIKYFDETQEDNISNLLSAFEKLDGTCVGIYQLKDHNNKVIEYVPKSRQKAVLDEHFQEMLKYCNTRLIPDFMKKYPVSSVYMELFGMLNEHTLPHKQTYIDVRLIGAVDSETHKMVSPKTLEFYSKLTCISLPVKIAKIVKMEDGGYYVRINNNVYDGLKVTLANDFTEVINAIKEHLDKANNISKEEKGYLCYEGVVLQNPVGKNPETTVQYIKIKPQTFLDYSDIESELTVPINEIRKEVRKIINENITEYSRSYDEKETISGIKEALLEEYSESDVNHSKVKKVILKELHKYIDSISDGSINRIVDEIIKEFSESDVKMSDMMKYFAQKYPMRKHQSGDVYLILKKRLDKLGINYK